MPHTHTPLLQLGPVQLAPSGKRERETELLEKLATTFVQNVSHELRTPLSIVQGYAELLNNGDLGTLTAEQQQAMQAIVTCTHQLHTLVKRIGILLSVEARAGVLELLALDEIAQKVVNERQSAATEAGIALTLRVGAKLPPILGDWQHIQQAVDCLVENALKFTPEGGQVEVQVYAHHGQVHLGVIDTGIGIPEEEQGRIFGFYQVDSSATRRYSGVGLGLTLVKEVVEEYAGQVELESQPGRGSRFRIRFPALSSTTNTHTSKRHTLEHFRKQLGRHSTLKRHEHPAKL